MVEFRFLEGKLLVGHSAEDDDRIENGEEMYRNVVFENQHLSLEFKSGIGGYYPLDDEDIQEEDNKDIYYPHVNETQMNPFFGNTEGFDEFVQDVLLKYVVVNGDMYVVSQNEITAYGPIFFHNSGVPYVAKDPMLMEPQGPYDGDEFLGIEPVDQPIQVENIETGYSEPVDYDMLAEVIRNDDMNGLVKLEEPEDILYSMTREL